MNFNFVKTTYFSKFYETFKSRKELLGYWHVIAILHKMDETRCVTAFRKKSLELFWFKIFTGSE